MNVDDDENHRSIYSVNDIVGEIQIPYQAELIEGDEKVSVNMVHIRGWFEKYGEQ